MLKRNKREFDKECACCREETLTCEPCDCDEIVEGKEKIVE